MSIHTTRKIPRPMSGGKDATQRSGDLACPGGCGGVFSEVDSNGVHRATWLTPLPPQQHVIRPCGTAGGVSPGGRGKELADTCLHLQEQSNLVTVSFLSFSSCLSLTL